MERIVIAVVIAAAAAIVAAVVARRNAVPSEAPPEHHVPTQVDRSDFVEPDRPWLVAVFTSATCSTCSATWQKAQILEADAVAVQEVEVAADPELHQRYGIDAVPTTVIADAEGVVRESFLGPVSATHLWAGLAEIREPGSVPGSCGVSDESSPNTHD